MTYEVLLYYQFFSIDDPSEFAARHRDWLRKREIRGRVYVSSEGINGTVAGTPAQMNEYRDMLRSIPGCERIEFKLDTSDFIPFAKLTCKVRREIVALHAGELDPAEGGRHLQPAEWRGVLESGEDYTLIDVRNDYESRIGHFDGAVLPPVSNFYDFPEWLEQAQIPKDRKILMYCTGGIRCEKFSVLMKQKGWEDVNQLHGGILNYAKEEGGAHFKGKCFVFDDRMAVPVNRAEEQVLGVCELTDKPADTYINCANMECNRLFLCAPEGLAVHEGCCSAACAQSEYKRPYEPESALQPFRKWYHYFDEDFKTRSRVRERTDSPNAGPDRSAL